MRDLIYKTYNSNNQYTKLNKISVTNHGYPSFLTNRGLKPSAGEGNRLPNMVIPLLN